MEPFKLTAFVGPVGSALHEKRTVVEAHIIVLLIATEPRYLGHKNVNALVLLGKSGGVFDVSAREKPTEFRTVAVGPHLWFACQNGYGAIVRTSRLEVK